MMPQNRIVSAAVAALIGVAILCVLGAWQLQRLAWKQGLIAGIEDKLGRDPVPFEGLALEADKDFTKVSLTGTYVTAANLFLLTTFEKSAGYHVATPLVLADGRVILVDRGVIPAAARQTYAGEPPLGEATLTGLLRISRDPPGMFTPENNKEAGDWYWWDVPAMLSTAALPEAAKVTPVPVQLRPGATADDLPRPLPPTVNLTNNHLQYAVTWFGFAVVLAIVAILFIRQQMKKSVA
jgi:surfeit locus 1 family protein